MAGPIDDEDDAPLDLAPWEPWPTCPACGARRQARCPTCGFAANHFPLADYQELGAELRSPATRPPRDSSDARAANVLLMCPACEEAFRPVFYDRCAACGHEFDGGVRPEIPDDELLTPRILGSIAALFALAVAFFVYYWLVLRPD
jgi:hypothetical protein